MSKTKPYEWHIQQYTGTQYGWETVCVESLYTEAKQRRKEYICNQPEYAVRIKQIKQHAGHIVTSGVLNG